MPRPAAERKRRRERDVISILATFSEEGNSNPSNREIYERLKSQEQLKDQKDWGYPSDTKGVRTVRLTRGRLNRQSVNKGRLSLRKKDVEARYRARVVYIEDMKKAKPNLTRLEAQKIIKQSQPRPEAFRGLSPEGMRNAVDRAFNDCESGKYASDTEVNNEGVQAGKPSFFVSPPVGNSAATLEKIAAMLEEVNELFALAKRQEDERNARIAAGFARFDAERANYELRIANLEHALSAKDLTQAEQMLEARHRDREIIAGLRLDIEQLEIKLRSYASNHTKLDPKRHFVMYSD